MSFQLYISSSCKIDNRNVFKDGILVLKNDGDIQEWLSKIYKQFEFNYPRFYKMDNLSKLGWLAGEVLLKDDFHKKYQPEDKGIVLANKNSSLDTDIKYLETLNTMASPALFVYTLPNIVMGEMSIRHQLKGENALFVSEDFDIKFLHQYVESLFEVNAIGSCVCGWLEFYEKNADACLWFVEKYENGTSIPFTEKNIKKLYQLTNG